MSRHRLVRNISIDDELADDYYDSYDDDDEYDDDDTPDTARIASSAVVAPASAQHDGPGLSLAAHISSVVGPTFSTAQITAALLAANYDVDVAATALLDAGPDNNVSMSPAPHTPSPKGNSTILASKPSRARLVAANSTTTTTSICTRFRIVTSLDRFSALRIRKTLSAARSSILLNTVPSSAIIPLARTVIQNPSSNNFASAIADVDGSFVVRSRLPLIADPHPERHVFLRSKIPFLVSSIQQDNKPLNQSFISTITNETRRIATTISLVDEVHQQKRVKGKGNYDKENDNNNDEDDHDERRRKPTTLYRTLLERPKIAFDAVRWLESPITDNHADSHIKNNTDTPIPQQSSLSMNSSSFNDANNTMQSTSESVLATMMVNVNHNAESSSMTDVVNVTQNTLNNDSIVKDTISPFLEEILVACGPYDKQLRSQLTEASKYDSIRFKFDTLSPEELAEQARAKSTVPGSQRNYTPIIKVSKASTAPKQRQPKYLSKNQLNHDGNQPLSSKPGEDGSSSMPRSISDASIAAIKKSTSTTSMKLDSSTESIVSSSGKSGVQITKAQRAKRVDVLQEYKTRENQDVSNINLVVVGHVDAGKSTLMGHTLFLLGEVPERLLRKYEKDAENIKKGSFSFAWILDETEEERSRGVTIDVAMSGFRTQHRSFTLLDAPGHRDFVPNMISGASQADAAVLVVDSTIGSFESGFDNGGQTREHAILVRSLGIQQLVVVVNKLDTCSFSKERFDYIKDTLTLFLTSKVGFRKNKLTFIPVSGFGGENIIKRQNEDLKSWYSGPTFVEQLDKLESPERPIDGVFRLSVTDVFKAATHLGGVTIAGRIESGNVQVSDLLKIIPTGEMVQVKSVVVEGRPVGTTTSLTSSSAAPNTNTGSNSQLAFEASSRLWAVAGDSVQLNIGNVDPQLLFIGSVLCDPRSPISVSARFRAQIVTFDISHPLTLGAPIVVHHQSVTEPATISFLVSLIDKSTGEIIRKTPRAIPKNSTAVVEVTTKRPICIETFKVSRDFGRILLRIGTETVAAGIVTDLIN